MNIALLCAYFYLLFDFSGSYESWLLKSMKKNLPPVEYYEKLKNVQSSLLENNESLEIALDSGDSESLPDADLDIVKEFVYKNSRNDLKLFEFGEEEFTQLSKDGKSYVSVNKDVFSLIRYDDSFRVMEKIEWSNSTKYESVVMKSKTKWFYDSKIRREEENFVDGKKTVVYYNDSNLPEKVDVFSDGKKLNTENFIYDKEGRAIEEELIIFLENGNFSTRKKVFVFKEELPEPDLYFYEDGVLHLKRLYITPEVYTEDVYFDGGFSVKVKYENGVRVKEIIIRENENEK